MTTQEIANRLVELCRAGRNAEAYAELYADDALALEPEGMPGGRVQGKDNLIAKTAQFEEMVEERYGNEVSDPIVTNTHFAIRMAMDIKMHGRDRSVIEEICLYEVKNEKIVREQFIYAMPEM